MLKIASPRYTLRHLLEKRAQARMSDILRQRGSVPADLRPKPTSMSQLLGQMRRTRPPQVPVAEAPVAEAPATPVLPTAAPAAMPEGQSPAAEPTNAIEAEGLTYDSAAQGRADSEFGKQLYSQQN